jgi:hypothetical protein
MRPRIGVRSADKLSVMPAEAGTHDRPRIELFDLQASYPSGARLRRRTEHHDRLFNPGSMRASTPSPRMK